MREYQGNRALSAQVSKAGRAAFFGGRWGGVVVMSAEMSCGGLRESIAASVSWFRMRARGWLSPDGVEAKVDIGTEDIKRALAVCESAIEAAIVPWLVFGQFEPDHAPPIPVHIVGLDDVFPRKSLVIIPQMKFANSRFDFALLVRDLGVRRIVAIECDGRDFHDVRKDMTRDAYFEGWGISTIRLYGSDIHRSPQRAVEKCVHHVLGLQLAAAHG